MSKYKTLEEDDLSVVESLLTEDTSLIKKPEADIKIPRRIITRGDPVFMGKIPLRNELTVLPADNPSPKPIGWTIHENIGIGVVNMRDPNLTEVTDVMEM